MNMMAGAARTQVTLEATNLRRINENSVLVNLSSGPHDSNECRNISRHLEALGTFANLIVNLGQCDSISFDLITWLSVQQKNKAVSLVLTEVPPAVQCDAIFGKCFRLFNAKGLEEAISACGGIESETVADDILSLPSPVQPGPESPGVSPGSSTRIDQSNECIFEKSGTSERQEVKIIISEPRLIDDIRATQSLATCLSQIVVGSSVEIDCETLIDLGGEAKILLLGFLQRANRQGIGCQFTGLNINVRAQLAKILPNEMVEKYLPIVSA